MTVCVSWMSFWLDHKSAPARVMLTITTLLAMSTTTASINNSLPPVAYTKVNQSFMASYFALFYIIDSMLVLEFTTKKSLCISGWIRPFEAWKKKKSMVIELLWSLIWLKLFHFLKIKSFIKHLNIYKIVSDVCPAHVIKWPQTTLFWHLPCDKLFTKNVPKVLINRWIPYWKIKRSIFFFAININPCRRRSTEYKT